ncbi:MAG: SCO family protein [Pseudomonadota bacterium]
MTIFDAAVRRLRVAVIVSVTTLFVATLSVGPSQAAGATTLPFYDTPEFTPRWLRPGSAALAGFHRVPAFEFTNQAGDTITGRDVAGRIYVASFFFSTCPGICPMIRTRLDQVQAAYADDDDVLILSHSIRPATDTVEVLRDYAQRHGVIDGKWHLLTGDREKIYALARETYFANEDLGEQRSSDDFLHTENLILVDPRGHIRGVYSGLSKSSVGHLIDDIAVLKREGRPTR